jgi:Domain of unknown function (DUF4249)
MDLNQYTNNRKWPVFNFTTIRITACVLVMAGASCKKSYNLSVINTSVSYLVIEGVINSGGDSTIIKITRTINLAQVASDPLTKAVVTIEDNQNGSFILSEKNKGIYVSPGLNIDKTKQYRLRVKTTDNEVYLSDYEPVLTTPPIDSVGFSIGIDGLKVYVNTHDATNSVKYYRWSYTEPWEFHSFYPSSAMVQGDSLVERTEDQEIYFCYGTNNSSDIPLTSTSNLAQSTLYQKEIAFVPSTSEKLETRYGIAVSQYALTADAYNFYLLLEQNTEQLGSIFDAEPSQIQGNIHCLANPQQSVIGYIGVSNVTTQKAFISYSALPQTWVATYPAFCIISPNTPGVDLVATYIAENPKQFQFTDIARDHSTPICVDCTLRGSRTPPPFWVY